jgi:DNA modification methylase
MNEIHSDRYQLLIGDARQQLQQLDAGSVQTVVTSPPYWGLRNYGHDDQLGHEPTPDAYIEAMVTVFAEVHRTLADTGTLWLNIGDSYASYRDGKATPDSSRGTSTGTLVEKGKAANRSARSFENTSIKHKDLVGIPWRLAFALQAEGWHLRQDIIWNKPNPMPESVRDRCTKAHEYIFLLTKQAHYDYNSEAIDESTTDRRSIDDASTTHRRRIETRNRRSVWTIPTKPFHGAHFATMPDEIAELCIQAGSQRGDLVLDPFAGSGTTGVAALKLDRKFVGIELNPHYAEIAHRRLRSSYYQPELFEAAQ